MKNIGDYQIKSILGKGGMATVYLAINTKFDVPVAVKVLNREFLHNSNIRNRFFSEAKTLYKLSHPNIVKVTDLIDDIELAAFVMDYVDGITLKDLLDTKGSFNDEEIHASVFQMLDALEYIHQRKLVHRDIKPANFMVAKDGRIVMMDFGIVKNLDPNAAEYTITDPNAQMGTLMYMSPEQVKSTRDVDETSDIYSIGVVLWQMVTGVRPYDAKTLSSFDIQLKIVTEQLRKTNTKWDELIQRATAKDISKRLPTVALFRQEIQQLRNTVINDRNQFARETDTFKYVHLGNEKSSPTTSGKSIPNNWNEDTVFNDEETDIEFNQEAYELARYKEDQLNFINHLAKMVPKMHYFVKNNNKDSNSYLEKNINTEKFEKFKQRFSLLLTNEKFKVLWYFDDTVFGKGDDGGAIVVKGEHVYLLFANISDKLNIFEIINLKNIDQLVHKTFDFVFDVNPYKSFLSSGITITSGASQTLAYSVNISIRDKYIVLGLVYLWSKINSDK